MYACMGFLYDGPTKVASTLIGLEIALSSTSHSLLSLSAAFGEGGGTSVWATLSGSSFTIRYRKVQSDLPCATGAAHLLVPAAIGISSCSRAQYSCPQSSIF